MLQDILLEKNGSAVESICSSCLNDVKDVIVSHVRETLSNGSAFHEWIVERIDEVLEKWRVDCDAFITTLVRMEANMNRFHKDFEDQLIIFSNLKPRKNGTSHADEWEHNSDHASTYTEAKINEMTSNTPTVSYYKDVENSTRKRDSKHKHKFVKKAKDRFMKKNQSPSSPVTTSPKTKNAIATLNEIINNNSIVNTHYSQDMRSPHDNRFGGEAEDLDSGDGEESYEQVTVKVLNNVFDIARNNIKDGVPKAIKYFFIKRILDRDLETEVVNMWDTFKEREKDIGEEDKGQSELPKIMEATDEDKEKRLKIKVAENALK